MYFRYFVIISPWKRAGSFIWTNLSPLHPRMLCAKFGWNWLSGSWEEDFLILSPYFLLFRNYLSLEKGRVLHLNKLESSSPKDALCQVWLKLAQWFLRRWFLHFVNLCSLFRNYLPMEKGGAHLFEQTWIPFTLGCIVPSLVEIGRVVLDKKFFLISSIFFCYFVIISPW